MMRTEVQDLDRFREWPDDPTGRPMGPMRFIERQIPTPGQDPAAGSVTTTTVRILQVWAFRQFTDEHGKAVSDQAVRGVQRRGETGWFDVPLETFP